MNNIAIYLRISVLEKGNLGHTEDTINSQRNIIKNFIFNDQELKKANIEEFIDEGYSGSTTSRPGTRQATFEGKTGKDKLYYSKRYVTIYEKLYRNG